jgi:hypothetical protein
LNQYSFYLGFCAIFVVYFLFFQNKTTTYTMLSIFNPANNEAFIQRIEGLAPTATAQWGKMNIAQMLAHAQQPLRVATGELQLKQGFMGKLFGASARKKLTRDDAPFKRGMPTDPNFVIRDQRDFEVEQEQLIRLVRQFVNTGPYILTTQPHPFFGPLQVPEWDALLSKHLDHHLRQFGA